MKREMKHAVVRSARGRMLGASDHAEQRTPHLQANTCAIERAGPSFNSTCVSEPADFLLVTVVAKSCYHSLPIQGDLRGTITHSRSSELPAFRSSCVSKDWSWGHS